VSDILKVGAVVMAIYAGTFWKAKITATNYDHDDVKTVMVEFDNEKTAKGGLNYDEVKQRINRAR
jgi:hypothetical protein